MARTHRLGKVLEPGVRSWRRATPEDRAAYFKQAAVYLLERKRREVWAGIGADGRPLRPAKLPHGQGYRAYPPALLKEYYRTATLLRTRSDGDSCTIYWAPGDKALTAGKTWGQILELHARGATIRVFGGPRYKLPVRDTIGISPAGVIVVRGKLYHWWQGYIRTRARSER
jgi:hypothetical protein